MKELVTLHTFTNPKFGTISAVVVDGEVLFKATDVAKAFSYRSPDYAIQRFAKDVRRVKVPNKFNGSCVTRFLPRTDVNVLADNAPSKNAPVFLYWIDSEIIPSIRAKTEKVEYQEDATPEVTYTLSEQEIIKQEWESLSREWDFINRTIKGLDAYYAYIDHVYQRGHAVSTEIIQSEYGLSDEELYSALVRFGSVQYTEEGVRVSEEFRKSNYIIIVEVTTEEELSKQILLWTVEGQLYLNRQFFKEGIYPVIKTKTATADPNE